MISKEFPEAYTGTDDDIWLPVNKAFAYDMLVFVTSNEAGRGPV